MVKTINRRQQALLCGSEQSSEQYDLPMHIAALFIILTVSASACAFPLIAARVPRLRIPQNFLFVVRHFGTGVLLATAFIHLFPTAFISLTDPCLPSFWNEDYPAMAGAIALASVFIITSIEMLLSPGRKVCCTRFEDVEVGTEKSLAQTNELSSGPTSKEQTLATHTPTSPSDTLSVLKSTQTLKRATLQVLLLELSILFHSIFIGLSLAVSTGHAHILLLIAITFHQLFEGLALGSRIAAVPWPSHTLQPWLMALAYGCTTPLGQAIGIATHELYDPASTVGLLMVGVMNAISAGLLTYTSLVDLLGEDFLSEESWMGLRGGRRVAAFGLVGVGAGLTGLVGAWA